MFIFYIILLILFLFFIYIICKNYYLGCCYSCIYADFIDKNLCYCKLLNKRHYILASCNSYKKLKNGGVE